MKRLIIILLIISAGYSAMSQQLVLSGKITYERKENMHKSLTDKGDWIEKMKEKMPKYRTDIFQLHFNTKQSLYKLIEEEESPFAQWWRWAATNTVYTNFETGRQTAEKTIYEMNYRLEDSLPALQWKMLGEYREIAGYNCRKAGAIINDSLYIIAFFTEQIPVSSGPESIKGLPGMVLGVVIPKIHITIFATKVETVPPTEKELTYTPQKKFKQSTQKDFISEIMKALKEWGEYATKIYYKALL
jgi:GLPGLI family protein